MKNGYYSLKEVAEVAKKHKYKLAELVDQSGKKHLSHAVTKKPEVFITDTIQGFAARPETKQGAYFINLYSDTRKNVEPASYPVYIGNVAAAAAVAPQAPVVHVNMPKTAALSENNPLTWQSAMDYQGKIKDLEVKVKTLEMENAQLKAKNQTLEESNEKYLADGEQASFWNNIAQVGLPMLSEWFAERKEQRKLEAMKLAVANPAFQPYLSEFIQPGEQGPRPSERTAQQFREMQQRTLILKKADEFLSQISDEEYDQVESERQAFEAAGGKDHIQFINGLSERLPEIYARLEQYIQGGGQ